MRLQLGCLIEESYVEKALGLLTFGSLSTHGTSRNDLKPPLSGSRAIGHQLGSSSSTTHVTIKRLISRSPMYPAVDIRH